MGELTVREFFKNILGGEQAVRFTVRELTAHLMSLDANRAFGGHTPDREGIQICAVARIDTRRVVVSGRGSRELNHERNGSLTFLLRRSASAIVVVACIAAARVEHRTESVTRSSRRRRDDPRAVEKSIADKETASKLYIQIRGRLCEGFVTRVADGRRAARVHVEEC